MQHIEHTLGGFKEYIESESGIFIKSTNQSILKLEFLTEEIVRVCYSTDGVFEGDFSYGISKRFHPRKPKIEVNEGTTNLEFSTSAFKVVVNKLDCKLTFTTLDNQIVNRDERGFHWEENVVSGGNIVKMGKVLQEGEHFYGLGDKTMHLNLRGRRVANWAMDTYGYKKEEDPIYKSIPFYIGIHSKLGYGIFFDNTFKAYFDFGSERKFVTSFWSEGGEMNYYYIHGPKMMDVIKRYTELTGSPDLPPLWALGYQQSKWSYYPESKVLDIASKMRKLRIPCDAIYIDIDYMDGFRCFTWDKKKFPNPKGMVEALLNKGFKTVAIIDPGIKIDPEYQIYKEGIEENYFVRRGDGPLLKGNVWPGMCHFPDFTNPKVRKWWSGLFKEMIQDIGIRGIWNDMNEPALLETEGKTFPQDCRHDFDGHPCSHRKAHNIYGTQMARSTFKGVKKFLNDKRPLVITRAAYAGAQRYAASWTGDNIASWEHLWLATIQCQRLATTGFSFVGTDVGGFIDHPTPELYIRWVQLAAFHPFFRTHSSGDHGDQEPWSFGDKILDIARKFIEFRYQLLPYIYTTFYQYTEYFTPMLRPISVYDQSDDDTLYRADEFLLGDSLLVCPVLEPNATSRYVYLPKGQWYHYWTSRLWEGGKETQIDAPIDEIPLFVKAGAVIPFFPVQQYVGEKSIQQLELRVYYIDGLFESILYEDEGDGYEYEKGIYNVKTFIVEGSQNRFKMTLKKRGHYIPTYPTYKIRIFGIPFEIKEILVNDKNVAIEEVQREAESLMFILERNSFIALEIKG